MKKTKYKLEALKAVVIQEAQVPSDVLERIADYESFSTVGISDAPQVTDLIYGVNTLKRILQDKNDDTNETTKLRVEELYSQVKKFDLLIIKG